MGIIFNTRKTGDKSGVRGGGCCSGVGIILIPARRGSDLVGSEMFPHNPYLVQVLFLIPA